MTDSSTKPSPFLKSIAALIIVFLSLPVVIVIIGVIFFSSNLSTYHFGLHYFMFSVLCSIPIYLLYRKRNSYKNLNDTLLFFFASITAISYITEDELALFAKLPSADLQAEHPVIFFIVLIKLILMVNCSIAKTIISFHEWIKASNSEVTTSFNESWENTKKNIQSFFRKLFSIPKISKMNDCHNNQHRNEKHIHNENSSDK